MNTPNKTQQAAEAEKDYQRVLNRLFESFVLEDQRNYYLWSVNKNERAGASITIWRVMFTLIGGGAAILISTLTGLAGAEMNADTRALIIVLSVIAVVAPALGTAATTIADLFQWDRLNTVYRAALRNLEHADAISPIDELSPEDYRTQLEVFAQRTLDVMEYEATQWGQLNSEPKQLRAFVTASQRRFAAEAEAENGDQEP